MKIQRAAVVGAGAMGSGIAQVLSQAGIEVILKDVSHDFVDAGLTKIKKMYESRVQKQVLTQSEADYLFGMLKGTTTYDGFNDVDLVIEAALEQIDVKLDIFRDLDRVCPPHAILATNTSALSITEIGAATRRPEKVIGMHYFNPAHVMKLVEVIPGLKTSNETVDVALNLCRETNKIPVRVKECPGFLVNRLLFTYMNEAVYVLEEGIATCEEVDRAVVEAGLPMGPFTLFDMTGIDVCGHVEKFLHREYGQRFAPARLIELMMKHKFLGQKTGAGFYTHVKGAVPKKDEPRQLNPELGKLLEEVRKTSPQAKASRPFEAYRVILPMFNEAMYAIQEEVVAASDVDVAMQWGCGMSKGLLSIADEKGLEWVLNKIEYFQEAYGERFQPAWMLRKLVRGGVKTLASLEPAPLAVH